jgi:hypothetical protein
MVSYVRVLWKPDTFEFEGSRSCPPELGPILRNYGRLVKRTALQVPPNHLIPDVHLRACTMYIRIRSCIFEGPLSWRV